MLNEARVLAIIPISRTTLYRMEKAGRFPKSTYISPNRRVWYEDQIVAWQNAVNEFDPRRARSGASATGCLIFGAAGIAESTVTGHLGLYSAHMIIINADLHVSAAN